MKPVKAGNKDKLLEKGELMQKYFTKLEDYKGVSKHPLRDKIICYISMTLIFIVSMLLMLGVCGALEVM
jgi:hypothetical protein